MKYLDFAKNSVNQNANIPNKALIYFHDIYIIEKTITFPMKSYVGWNITVTIKCFYRAEKCIRVKEFGQITLELVGRICILNFQKNTGQDIKLF